MQPRRPHVHATPPRSTTTWPISPAPPRPSQGWPSRIRPPPTPVPQKTPRSAGRAGRRRGRTRPPWPPSTSLPRTMRRAEALAEDGRQGVGPDQSGQVYGPGDGSGGGVDAAGAPDADAREVRVSTPAPRAAGRPSTIAAATAGGPPVTASAGGRWPRTVSPASTTTRLDLGAADVDPARADSWTPSLSGTSRADRPGRGRRQGCAVLVRTK